jgi:acyl carrier protein
MIDVVLDVEEAFDIRIEDEDAEKLKTVGDALRLISSLTGQ